MEKKVKEKRNLEKTRRRILDAAAQEFARRGLAGTRMDAIAQKAKVSKAMIYFSIGGKDDLHLAVIEELFQEKIESLDLPVSSLALDREAFLSLFIAYYDSFIKRKDYARILINDVVTGGGALKRLAQKRPDLFAVFEVLTGMIKNAGKSGAIRVLDADKAILLMILILTSLIAMQPHMEFARKKGTQEYKDLSDLEQWKTFLTDILDRVLNKG